MIAFWNQYNFGDCFWHCLYLRALVRDNPSREFSFYCRPELHPELRPVVQDMPQIRLLDLAIKPTTAHPCWIGLFRNQHEFEHDVVRFLLDWFRHLSSAHALVNPFIRREDMLADYPAILDTPRMSPPPFDWLVINSHAMSGQFQNDDVAFQRLLAGLAVKHRVIATSHAGFLPVGVTCTRDLGMTMTEIGNLSLRCRNLLAVTTGPMWPTWNVWNQRHFDNRIILSNDFIHNYGGEPVEHFGSVTAVMNHLASKGVI